PRSCRGHLLVPERRAGVAAPGHGTPRGARAGDIMSTPVLIASLLEAFFTRRLLRERGVSPNTVAAYRDAFRLLLGFAQRRLSKVPSELTVADLDAPLIGAFLDHLERERGNTVRTR